MYGERTSQTALWCLRLQDPVEIPKGSNKIHYSQMCRRVYPSWPRMSGQNESELEKMLVIGKMEQTDVYVLELLGMQVEGG